MTNLPILVGSDQRKDHDCILLSLVRVDCVDAQQPPEPTIPRVPRYSHLYLGLLTGVHTDDADR
ncbi:hypothetical protein D9M69_633290 [compost metagenome]